MNNPLSKHRPKNLDLTTIKLPLPGIVSILHRVSGALMYLVGIPLVLGMLQFSLRSRESFLGLAATLSGPLAKLFLLGMLWALWHHFCAGVRFLLLDLHKGVEIEAARNSSRWVLGCSLALTVLSGIALW